jgi:hypothetical protein
VRFVAAAALAFTLSLGPASSADAKWRYVTCGSIVANGLGNNAVSGGTYKPVPCAEARSALTTYLRTTNRNVGRSRCNGGGSNGAVLGQCTRHNLFIVVYDASYGE